MIESFRELAQAALVGEQPSIAAYLRAAGQLPASLSERPPVRVALLASFTAGPLIPALKVEAAFRDVSSDIYLAPFDTTIQELLDTKSGCARYRPHIVVVAQLLGDVAPPLQRSFLSLSDEVIERLVDSALQQLVSALATFRRHSSAAVVVLNFPASDLPPLGIYEVMAERSQTEVIRELNRRLVNACRGFSGVYVLDFDRICAATGYETWRDERMWHLARAPLSARTLAALARELAVYFQALVGGRRKCLVVDLDNTLWGGVVGEDGIAGIQLGHTYPGNVFRQFQETLLQLHQRGVLLAINSKNNQADVDEVLGAHPDMVLKPEHFASIKVNWRAKPDNMIEIADELRLGLDSLVFFDDSPAERAMMRETLPQVVTLETPPDPIKYSHALLRSRMFDTLTFSREDQRRGRMYQEEKARAQLAHATLSREEFLKGLEMRIQIGAADTLAFPRILELVHKTNQFNLTTRRYSATELADIIADSDCDVFFTRLSDRFGDQGIIGVAVLRLVGDVAAIETFLMSCRVIGRGVETAFLAFIAECGLGRGVTKLRGEFVRSAKNSPARDFYSSHGFTLVSDPSNEDRSTWEIQLRDGVLPRPSYVALVEDILP